MLHILDLSGQHIKSFEVHSASVTDISMDITAEWIATTSIDGETSLVFIFILQRMGVSSLLMRIY